MKTGRFFAAIFALCCLAALPLSAGAEGMEFTLNGIRFNDALLGGVPVPAGVDVELRFPIAGDRLFYTIRLAGGYEDRLILRDDADGSPLPKPASFDVDDQAHWFHWPNAEADTGLLYRFPPREPGPTVEFFGLARGRYEGNSPVLSSAYFPDARDLLAVSFMGGVGVSTIYTSPRRFKSGFAGELSLEYAPPATAFAGGTDFFRISGKLEGYLPIFTWGASDQSAVSLYAAGYLAGDHAVGGEIPLYVLTSFGGRDLRSGLGSSIRGYQPWGYEAASKAEASFDLRLVGPGLFGLSALRPMAYIFGDAGFFSGLYDSPTADKDGLLLSTGAGAALNIFDFAYLGLRAGWKGMGRDPLHNIYFPGYETFFWGITFLLHF